MDAENSTFMQNLGYCRQGGGGEERKEGGLHTHGSLYPAPVMPPPSNLSPLPSRCRFPPEYLKEKMLVVMPGDKPCDDAGERS